jgi:hypothetical protein
MSQKSGINGGYVQEVTVLGVLKRHRTAMDGNPLSGSTVEMSPKGKTWISSFISASLSPTKKTDASSLSETGPTSVDALISFQGGKWKQADASQCWKDEVQIHVVSPNFTLYFCLTLILLSLPVTQDKLVSAWSCLSNRCWDEDNHNGKC